MADPFSEALDRNSPSLFFGGPLHLRRPGQTPFWVDRNIVSQTLRTAAGVGDGERVDLRRAVKRLGPRAGRFLRLLLRDDPFRERRRAQASRTRQRANDHATADRGTLGALALRLHGPAGKRALDLALKGYTGQLIAQLRGKMPRATFEQAHWNLPDAIRDYELKQDPFWVAVAAEQRRILRQPSSPLAPRVERHKSALESAVVNVLAPHCDTAGKVDVQAVQRRWGKSAAQLLRAVRSAVRPADGTVTAGALLGGLSPRALRALRPARGIVPRMPAFRRLVRSHRGKRDFGSLAAVLAHQHVVGNTIPLLRQLTAKTTHVWGKPYSLDARAAAALQLRGFQLEGDTLDTARVESLVRSKIAALRASGGPAALATRKPAFLIVDDGGKLLAAVAKVLNNEPALGRYAHLFAGVEQTTNGLNRLERVKLPFAVYNVAKSWAKRRYGAPIYGYAVYQQTRALLGKLGRRGVRFGKQVTVFGYGDIGAQVARQFQRAGYRVTVYDKDPAQRAKAAARGHATAHHKRRVLARTKLLVSCVGREVLRTRDLLAMPHGALLVNGASAGEFNLDRAREWRAAKLDDPYQRVPLGPAPELPVSANHSLARFLGKSILVNREGRGNGVTLWQSRKGKQLLVARDGGVINFPMGLENSRCGSAIPGRYIQLEIGLLYLAMRQAARGGKPGMHHLQRAPQRALVLDVERQLRRRSKRRGQRESLRNPRW